MPGALANDPLTFHRMNKVQSIQLASQIRESRQHVPVLRTTRAVAYLVRCVGLRQKDALGLQCTDDLAMHGGARRTRQVTPDAYNAVPERRIHLIALEVSRDGVDHDALRGCKATCLCKTDCRPVERDHPIAVHGKIHGIASLALTET